MILSSSGDPIPAADVCVVGAGPAGLALAFKLHDCCLSVVILEAGPDNDTRPSSTSKTEYMTQNHAASSFTTRSGLRGTTTLWGGRCVTHGDRDSEQPPHVPFSGWPIQHSQVSRY